MNKQNNPKRPTERQRVAAGVQAMEQDGTILQLGELYTAIYPTSLALLYLTDKVEDITRRHGFFHFGLKHLAKAVERSAEAYSNEIFKMFFRGQGIDIDLAEMADKVEAAIMQCVKENVKIEKGTTENEARKE